MKILIVDDDRAIQYLFEQILLDNGFEVVGIANNGEEAINLYKTLIHKPDVILMDHRMPIKNGLEATQEILQINNHAKIIFTSADNNIREEALSLGVISFQEKPFDINKLVKIIHKIANVNQF